jgi:hypothetical protein
MSDNHDEVIADLNEIRLLLEIAERCFTIAGFRYAKETDAKARLMKVGDAAIESVMRVMEEIAE